MLQHMNLTIGPMFAGKTSRLIETYRQNISKGKRTLCFKPFFDKRFSNNNIISHDGEYIVSSNLFDKKEQYTEVLQLSNDFDEFIFDEVQFYQTYDEFNIIDLFVALNQIGKEMHVFGLNINHKGEPFKIIKELLTKCYKTKLTVLRSKCTICGEPADYSKRLVNSDEIFVLGGRESYEPRCYTHFFN